MDSDVDIKKTKNKSQRDVTSKKVDRRVTYLLYWDPLYALNSSIGGETNGIHRLPVRNLIQV